MSLQRPTDHFFDFTPETLKAWFLHRGLAPFKSTQLLDWVYAKGVIDPADMTTLSKRERELLAGPDGLTFISNRVVRHQAASDGTQKLLVEWIDRPLSPIPSPKAEGLSPSVPNTNIRLAQAASLGDSSRQTECVMIPSQDPTGARRTACISSQVGCPVGCKFCASGIGGLDGNLSAGRIIEQVWLMRDVLRKIGESTSEHPFPRMTNIVFMGMGEPLANFANVMHAVRTLAAPWGMGISARKITISTVGLPQAIERLADECDLPITLALSLHAPNDTIRRELIPWAEYTSIPELIAACHKWFKKTGREITLEYILLGGLNDQPAHARELARVARSLRANLNLIRYNEVKGMPFRRPLDDDVRTFQDILRDAGVNVHIRASRGRDIAAACGQLRHEKATA